MKMAYTVSWYVPNRLIRCQLEGNVVREEIKMANQILRELVAAGQNPIHCILEMNRLKNWPIDFRLFQEDYPFHHAKGWIVFVGGNARMRYVGGVVARFAGTQLYSCPSFGSALSFLKEKDPSLIEMLKELG